MLTVIRSRPIYLTCGCVCSVYCTVHHNVAIKYRCLLTYKFVSFAFNNVYSIMLMLNMAMCRKTVPSEDKLQKNSSNQSVTANKIIRLQVN